MATAVIACETIRDELECAIARVNVAYKIHWVISGLHNYPERLRAALQEQLDACSEYSRILMAFGACGNSVIGLRTGAYELIIPRVDDCISLLIGSTQKRMAIGEEGGAYFLTPGWLRGERNLLAEYNYTVEKYGEETAAMVMETMLAHYTYLCLLDTKCYDMNAITQEVSQMAEKLKLTQKIIPASVDYLCDLLRGPWEEKRFLVIPPNTVIEAFPLWLTKNEEVSAS